MLYNTSLRILCARLLALRNHIQTFYDGTAFIHKHLQHLTSPAFVFTGIYVNCIAFFNM